MKKLLLGLSVIVSMFASAQTFTVNNLQVNGTTNLVGTVSGIGIDTYIKNAAIAQKVADVAALRALSSCVPGQVYVTTTYYSAAFDQESAGVYYCNGSDTVSTDNGGTIIATAGTGYRLYLQYDNYVGIKQWGAKGDDSTDNLSVLQKAFAAFNVPLYINKGTYRFSATVIPQNNSIDGAGQDVAVLKPTAAVTKAISIGAAHYPRSLKNFQVDGTLTSAAIGVYLGDATSVAVEMDNVRIFNFLGTNAVCLRVGDVLKSTIANTTAFTCDTGLKMQKTTAGFPTSTNFINWVSTSSTQYGALIIDANQINFFGSIFESAGKEGMRLDSSSGSTIVDLLLYGGWFEANNGNNNTLFHLVSGTNSGVGTIRFGLIGTYFDTNAGGTAAKAVSVNGSENAGFLLNSPRFAGSFANAITVANGGYGSVDSWNPAWNYQTVVSDASNTVNNTNGSWKTYTPVYACSLGNAATCYSGGTVTTNIAHFKLLGKTLFLSLNFTATLNAVTPNYLQVSLPTGLMTQNNSTYSPAMITNGGVQQSGVYRTDGGGNVYFYFPNLTTNYTASQVAGGAVTAVIELQ